MWSATLRADQLPYGCISTRASINPKATDYRVAVSPEFYPRPRSPLQHSHVIPTTYPWTWFRQLPVELLLTIVFQGRPTYAMLLFPFIPSISPLCCIWDRFTLTLQINSVPSPLFWMSQPPLSQYPMVIRFHLILHLSERHKINDSSSSGSTSIYISYSTKTQ